MSAPPTTESTTRRGARLWGALSVLPDETSRVLWAGALFFVVLASASIGLNAADALFFLRFGVDMLPWMIMLSGLVVMIVTIGYAAGLAVFGARSWSWVITVVGAIWLAAERLAIAAEVPGIYPVVWLTGQVVIYVGFTLLWDVAGEMCDTRQAKRLFPLLMSAGIAGSVAGNALTGPLAGLLGTENLLIVQAAGLGLAGLIARITTQRFLGRRDSEEPSVLRDLRTGFETTARVPLFRLVAGVGAALSVLFFLVFFPFSEVAAASFETEEALAGFLGLFSSLATAATFLVSLLVANRLFNKVGVVVVLLITATVYVAGFSLWLVSFGLFTATLFRGVQWVAINALGGTAFSSLFNVLTGEARSQVRDFVSAVPVQIGTVIAGAVLLLGNALSEMARTALSLAIAVAFLLLVLPMRRAYSAALIEAVRHGLSDVFTASLPGMQKPHGDAQTVAALKSGLDDPSPGRRRVTAVILGEVGGTAAADALQSLLADDDATVRLTAIESLAKNDASSAATAALALLGDPSLRVRRRAIGLLTTSSAAEPAVRAALEDDDSEVRSHAARIVGGEAGRGVINSIMRDGDGEAIAAALRCVLAAPDLAEVAPERFADHADNRVRAVAAELLVGRPNCEPTLHKLLDDSSNEVRLAAARALTVENRDAIHDVLEHGSVRAREAALQSLVAANDADDYLRGWAASELDRAADLHRFRTAIATTPGDASVAAEYLERVLEKRERMVERWVVTALATEDTRRILPLVTRGAISGDSDVRAEALEAIESLTDRTLARRLVALLEDPSDKFSMGRLEALQSLFADHQSWFRALAARTLYEELNRDLQQTNDRAGSDNSPVVRESIPAHSPAEPTPATAMTVVDAVLALQQASIFEHLDPEELEALAGLGQERRFEADAAVFQQGEAGTELLVVVDGAAVVRVQTDDGYTTIAESGPGEPVGELAILRERPRTAQVIAGPAGLHALVIAGEDFRSLLTEQPDLATALMAKLAERIAHSVDREGAGDLAPSSQESNV